MLSEERRHSTEQYKDADRVMLLASVRIALLTCLDVGSNSTSLLIELLESLHFKKTVLDGELGFLGVNRL